MNCPRGANWRHRAAPSRRAGEETLARVSGDEPLPDACGWFRNTNDGSDLANDFIVREAHGDYLNSPWMALEQAMGSARSDR